MLRAWLAGAGKKEAAGRSIRLKPQQRGPTQLSRYLSILQTGCKVSSPLHQAFCRRLHVLYRDAHIIVTNKAAGVLSQPDRQTDGAATDQLGLVRAYIKDITGKSGDAYVGLVHRLDRNVSGCMVFALRSKAAARLSYDFSNRLVSKIYVAMVVGKLHGAGMLADDLVHTQDNVTRVVEMGDQPHGKPNVLGEEDQKEAGKALLHYKSLGTFHHPRGGAQTLVQVRLVTGKKHQIRAQLAHLGHPIVGDVKYNAPSRFRDRFLALHCCSLSFRHPLIEPSSIGDDQGKKGQGVIGGQTDQKQGQRRKLTVHAPLPETWRARFGDEVLRLIEAQQRSFDKQNLPPP